MTGSVQEAQDAILRSNAAIEQTEALRKDVDAIKESMQRSDLRIDHLKAAVTLMGERQERATSEIYARIQQNHESVLDVMEGSFRVQDGQRKVIEDLIEAAPEIVAINNMRRANDKVWTRIRTVTLQAGAVAAAFTAMIALAKVAGWSGS